MEVLQALLLGVIQGLTEFIPISSSGHLILAEKLFHLETGGLTFDVMLHMGTLLALISFFWRDLLKIVQHMFKAKSSNLGWYILLGTMPALFAGVLLESLAESSFRSAGLVAFNLCIVALLMLWADSKPAQKTLKNVNAGNAFLIGVFQALALVPGVSRSGITIIAGRFSHFNRASAARFAFLLAIPITAGAVLRQLFSTNYYEITSNLSVVSVGVIASAITGYFTIKFLLVFLSQHSLKVFAYYRLVLAAVILLVLVI